MWIGDEYFNIMNERYYKESPAIFIRDYNEINERFVRNILENIDTYYEKNLKYYNDFLSTKAVSNYIIYMNNYKKLL